MQDRLYKLQNLREHVDDMYNEQINELDGVFKQAKRTGTAVDVAKSVIDIGTALVSAARVATQTLSKHGAELEKLNKEFFEKVQHVRKETRSAVLKDPTMEYAKEHMPGNGLLWALGQTSIDTFLKYDSPSFWAWTFTQMRSGKSWSESVTSSPEQFYEESKSRLLRAKSQALSNIDGRIRELHDLLGQADSPRLH